LRRSEVRLCPPEKYLNFPLFQRFWNMTMLQSEDFVNAAMAQATKSPQPTFAKL